MLVFFILLVTIVLVGLVVLFGTLCDVSFGLPSIPFTFPYKTKIKEHVITNGKGEQVGVKYSCWGETVLGFYRPIIKDSYGKPRKYDNVLIANSELEEYLTENKQETKSTFL